MTSASSAYIDEAYLAVVKASDFVENVLLSADGNLRTQVFEENVRSFLGLDNPVNQSISLTARFITTGVYRRPDALEMALRDFKSQIDARDCRHWGAAEQF